MRDQEKKMVKENRAKRHIHMFWNRIKRDFSCIWTCGDPEAELPHWTSPVYAAWQWELVTYSSKLLIEGKMSTYNNLQNFVWIWRWARGWLCLSCQSGKLPKVHWKWNSCKSVDNFVKHYNARIGSPPMTWCLTVSDCIAVTQSQVESNGLTFGVSAQLYVFLVHGLQIVEACFYWGRTIVL